MISRTTNCGTTQVSCPPNLHPVSSRKIGTRQNGNPSTISEQYEIPCGTFGTHVGLGPSYGGIGADVGLGPFPRQPVRSQGRNSPAVAGRCDCRSQLRCCFERPTRHARLADDGQQRSGTQFPMIRHWNCHRALGADSLHRDVTAASSDFDETMDGENPTDFSSRQDA